MKEEALKVGFIGAGQMATALASGFLRAKIITPDSLFAFDISPEAGKNFQKKTKAQLVGSCLELVSGCDVIFFAVKPQQLASAIEELHIGKTKKLQNKLFVSIVAGVPLNWYEEKLGANARIVRVMPNTPCLIGEGASCFARSSHATTDDGELVRKFLQTVGIAHEISESKLDAVTGLSGSGPGYVFVMLEALADGGVQAGLPRALALELAAQTLRGSASLYLETKEHPGALKDKVTSPGGTTIAGIAEMEAWGVRAALIAAVNAAAERSAELAQ